MWLAALMTALLLTLAACGSTTQDSEEDGDEGDDVVAETEAPEDDTVDDDMTEDAGGGGGGIPADLSLAFLPKQINNPYFTIASTGAAEAAEEVSASYQETGPSDATASSQVSYINTLTQQGADAILVSANDPNAICPALNEARDGGAAVVTFDSDTTPDCRDLFINQATGEGIAQVQLDMVNEQLDGEGQFAILSATPNATNQNTWIELMEGMLDSNEDYAGLELVTVAYGNDDDQDSFQETQGLLQSYPDLDAIVAPTTVGIAAAARYISGSEYKGEVAVTGLGTPNQMREFVSDETVTAFALWNPGDLGYLAAYAGAALAGGVIEGEPGDTFEAGRLGEYEVEEDGVVVLGPPTVFDAENIDDFDF
jgi:rhamnose transport system substrate-binding protein